MSDPQNGKLPIQKEYSPLTSDTSKMFITKDHETIKRVIVTAANRHTESKVVVVGARHFSPAMMSQIQSMNLPEISGGRSCWEQGFIDQWDNFITRREAMTICVANGQRVDLKRNGGDDSILFSDGLH